MPKPHDNLVRIGEIDEATGLPRRKAFLRTVEAFLEESPIKDLERFWLATVQLPVLQYVRSSMGWEMADRYLKEVARFLQRELPHSLVIARMDGPDLAVAATQPEDRPDRETFDAPSFLGKVFHVDEQPLFLSLRAGLVWWSEGDSGPSLLRKASMALNRAGRETQGDFVVYDATMDQEAREGALIATELPGAMDREELELHYQPKIELKNGALTGVEALLRWPRPAGSAVPTPRLIEVAELTELIVPLGSWVLHRACRTAATWQAQGLRPFRIAVNVSAVQFIKSDLLAEIRNAMESAGIGPEWLEIELTESALASHGSSSGRSPASAFPSPSMTSARATPPSPT